jgi:hypothetical protein
MKTHDEYVKLIKASYVAISTRLTIVYFKSLHPVLNNDFVESILEVLSRNLFEFLANQTEIALFFKYIDIRVDDQAKDFELAAYHYWRAKETGTVEEIKDAEENMWIHFKKFASLSSK